jgi:hypothetical protein
LEDSPLTPGQLVKAVSIALDVPEETVVQHDRNLVVAGLRTTGARGRNAPAVTPLDAARVFVATLGSVRAKDSAATVRAYEDSICRPPLSDDELIAASKDWNPEAEKYSLALRSLNKDKKFSDHAVETLPAKHNFIQAIASLISDASHPIEDLDQHLQRFAELIVDCDNRYPTMARIGKIGAHGGSYSYERGLPSRSSKTTLKARDTSPEQPRYKRYARHYGISQRRSVFGSAIMLLGKAFRDGELPFETTRDAIDALVGSKKVPSKSKRKTA